MFVILLGLVVSFVIYSNAVTVPLVGKIRDNLTAPWDFQAILHFSL